MNVNLIDKLRYTSTALLWQERKDYAALMPFLTLIIPISCKNDHPLVFSKTSEYNRDHKHITKHEVFIHITVKRS